MTNSLFHATIWDMIRLLTGTVFAIEPNQLVLMTAGGVGYGVGITNRLLLVPGEVTTLYTYLAVRETALDLYGFIDQADRQLFELLLTISGIGPKSALQIMDQADRSLIIEAITLEDPVHLTKLSAVSKKTAEKIVLGLKDKIDISLQTIPQTPIHDTIYQDAFDTLVTLGYNPITIRQVLDQMTDFPTTSVVVSQALRVLS
ncbi:MAG: Holliday junction branch migration protein RuvA [Candidatus Parcubacteria bacterium]